MTFLSRFTAALTAATLLLTLTACDQADQTPTDTAPTTTAVTTEDSSEPTTATTTTVVSTEPTDVIGEPEPDVESSMVASFAAADSLGELAQTMFVINDTEYASPVILEAVGSVRDVKLIKLAVVMDENGTYQATATHTVTASMTNGEKKAVLIDFPGDMSAWGLSYVDNMGVTREHTLYMSGEDGSLVMADGIA